MGSAGRARLLDIALVNVRLTTLTTCTSFRLPAIESCLVTLFFVSVSSIVAALRFAFVPSIHVQAPKQLCCFPQASCFRFVYSHAIPSPHVYVAIVYVLSASYSHGAQRSSAIARSTIPRLLQSERISLQSPTKPCANLPVFQSRHGQIRTPAASVLDRTSTDPLANRNRLLIVV